MSEDDTSHVRFCTRHATVETLLRCARCARPFCVPCMVQSPVGYLCRECAGMRRLPQYMLAPRQYARIIPGALALALGMGFLLSYAVGIGFIGGIAVGLVVGAGLRRISGYKRGPEMEIIAACTVILAVVSSPVFLILRYAGIGHLADAIRLAMQGQTIGLNLFGIIIGVYIAIQQLR